MNELRKYTVGVIWKDGSIGDMPIEAYDAKDAMFIAEQSFGRKPFKIECGGDVNFPDQIDIDSTKSIKEEYCPEYAWMEFEYSYPQLGRLCLLCKNPNGLNPVWKVERISIIPPDKIYTHWIYLPEIKE